MAKKKEKMLNISYKKANIIGMIDSFIFGFGTSYFLSNFLITEFGLSGENVTTLKITCLLTPILFIIFGLFNLFFIVNCDYQSKK